MFRFLANFQHICSRKLHFPIRGTKKQQTAKDLLLKIGVFPISFMGCIYMAEELLNWLSLWPPNFVSSLFVLYFLYFL